ncbi:MAG: RING finger protein [Candidatus Babeliales bacterium]|jgi:hypothetical protein
MKKNVLLVVLFLIFANQSSFAMQPITVANLFEIIKGETAPKYMESSPKRVILCRDAISCKDEIPCKDKELDSYSGENPLVELAHFISIITSKSKGVVNPVELCAIKAFLKREGENRENIGNRFYGDLSTYLEKLYPTAHIFNFEDASQLSNQICTICLSRIEIGANPLILSCKHVFCYNCLFEWYTGRDLTKHDEAHRHCPTCRKELDYPFITLFISDYLYKDKSDIAMAEYGKQALQERILRILILGSHS